jgi:SAM-dependent methyltransferase
VSRLDDARLVREEYASERGLEARRAAYRDAEGDDPRELALDAVAEAEPSAVLEVGCGPGELAERIGRELGAAVVAVDQSERMVELASARGVDARIGDVQDLPFADGSFDCAVAAWMLYHVPDLDRGLAELHRVLRPGGRLVAVTNHHDHLIELREAIGAGHAFVDSSFSGENGAEVLARHFDGVQRRDAAGTATFGDTAAVASYVQAIMVAAAVAGDPYAVQVPLVARRHSAVFVAEKAA